MALDDLTITLFCFFPVPSGRDLICIQSMDGMLMLFEQESYAFGRFLPGFLLPGPLTYSSRTDSFITVSSCRHVESYKYQVLAFATDADKRQDSEQQKLGSGKRLVVDWTLNIGEQALDICIVSFNQSSSSVFVLGERNFFCLKDNGQIRFMKKLDCSPSCFLPYCSVSEGSINTLVGNHNNMLHIYQDVTLKWATQLPHVPVAVKVGSLQDLKGVIVTLSDQGHLQCSYLGTDPSLFQAPKVDSREVNYEELDVEMKDLQKIIRDVNKAPGSLPLTEAEDHLSVVATVCPNLDNVSVCEGAPWLGVTKNRGWLGGDAAREDRGRLRFQGAAWVWLGLQGAIPASPRRLSGPRRPCGASRAGPRAPRCEGRAQGPRWRADDGQGEPKGRLGQTWAGGGQDPAGGLAGCQSFL
uniref:PTHB1 N-terminal domain-containing protein n=1 Tax=Monodelphis domestica TaxID=13616 RepID=F7DMU6_MONDO